MRRHPSRWDVVNPRRAWFRELAEWAKLESWDHYRELYHMARLQFNSDFSFMGPWCLYRQPFYHRNSAWPHLWRRLSERPYLSILDFGCGTGEMLVWLADGVLRSRERWGGVHVAGAVKVDALHGVDLAFSPHNNYRLERLERRGFPQKPLRWTYDVVVCTETLEHMANPVETVDELISWVTPGGVLIWDFIDAHDGGANCARPQDREEVLRMLDAKHGGQNEVWTKGLRRP